MVKKKKKLSKEWETRTPKFEYKTETDRYYCIHWWSVFDCDGHGETITYSKSFPKTEVGWNGVQKLAKKCVNAGYRVSITKTGRI